MADSRAGVTGLVLRIALYCWIAAQLGEVIVGLDYVAGDGVNVWFGTRMVVSVAALVALLATVITAFIFLFWIHRAMSRARELTPTLTITPGWAVGWFFVPVASLWKPYEVMSEIVEGSSESAPPYAERTRALIGWWWGGWILRGILSLFENFAARSGESSSPINTRSVTMIVLASIVGIGSAWVLSMIVARVGRLQAAAVAVGNIFA
jgi:hypothetical protein